MKNGKKVFPEELETLLDAYDEVEDSFVFGMPSRKDDVKLAVKMIPDRHEIEEKYGNIGEEKIEKILEDILEAVNETLPPYKNIKRLIVSKEPFITTTTLKIKRQEELKRTLAALVQ